MILKTKLEFLHWSQRQAGWLLYGERGSPRRDPFAILHTLFLISLPVSIRKERTQRDCFLE